MQAAAQDSAPRGVSTSNGRRIAVVTGAAGGIGAAIARRLAADGWTIALADRDAGGLEAVAREIDESGERTSLHTIDLLDRDAPERLCDETVAAHGQIHALINNAGLTVVGALEQHSREDVERVLGVNLVAVAQLCRVFAPVLIASVPSAVVNVASFAGVVAFPNQAVYSASKFGVRGLSEALRIELSDRGVAVSAILPGTVATSLIGRAATYDASMTSSVTELMLRYGAAPDAVARAVVACLRDGRAERLVGWDAHFGVSMKRWLPAVVRAGFRRGWKSYRSRRG